MFQFTIRDLLLVTVIVALYVGWAGDRNEMGARIERLEQERSVVWIHPNINISGYQRIQGRFPGLPITTDY
ncbi:MAG TPA: hypothetical protein VMP01_13970 [Pirellulaceae bacterium]|nr:hypothetical protein [Pirellulaceae bacterium]